MEQRKSKRSLKLALVAGTALAGTALVGWGGLAAWNAYTQNTGNAFTAGSVSHSNQANGGVVCNSQGSTVTQCHVIVGDSNMGSGWTGKNGTVAITNTGSLASTFALSTPAAPTGPLCADLKLVVSDAASTYVTSDPIASISSTSLKSSGGSSSWAQNDSNTFTFAVTPNSSYTGDESAPGESCSFDVLFTQAA
ncbi:MAG TPA: hypothetical protein VEK76_04360 [Candidatus Binatia bacterium]|nr:hypothetical protein [Candidatus Binatia bacterium]